MPVRRGGRSQRAMTLLSLVGGLVVACGQAAPPASAPGSTASSASPAVSPGAATDGPLPIAVGPLEVSLADASAADHDTRSLVAVDDAERARLRGQAGLARETGSGWTSLAQATDAATNAAVGALATELGIEDPTALRDTRTAAVGAPIVPDPVDPTSAASALAVVTAALTAAQSLGSSGTRETSTTATERSTSGDDVSVVTVTSRGSITGSGSRVSADFTIDIAGAVTNSVSGATAQLRGTATAHVEIDGCPDAGGSTKGKLTLSSAETVNGQHDGGDGSASWTRDLSGLFDIHVNDQAEISGIAVDAQADESVTSSEREAGDDEPERDGHDLGVTFHTELGTDPGFTTLTTDDARTTGEVTREREATSAHIASLVRSAAWAIDSAAFLLGREAMRFWRDGQCVELLVDPEGGDVDANSVSEVVAKVRHRFEGNELDKPVVATLVGVTGVDPAGERQPAPATVRYTAGPSDGDTGDIAFESVSNRGIAKKTVRFTVRPAIWDLTFSGKHTEDMGPVANRFSATVSDLRVTAAEDVLSGTGKLRLKGTVVSGPCSGPLDQTSPITVSGSIDRSGTAPVLRITFQAVSSAGVVVHLRCKPSGGADLPAEGHAERFPEPLGELVLPVAGGTLQVDERRTLVALKVRVQGTFTLTPAG